MPAWMRRGGLPINLLMVMTPRVLSLLTLNVRGFDSVKTAHFVHLARSTYRSSILVLTETHLSKRIPASLLLPTHRLIQSPGSGRSGGLAVFIPVCISSAVISRHDESRVMQAITIGCDLPDGTTLSLICCYWSPNATRPVQRSMSDYLDAAIPNDCDYTVVIGDLNPSKHSRLVDRLGAGFNLIDAASFLEGAAVRNTYLPAGTRPDRVFVSSTDFVRQVGYPIQLVPNDHVSVNLLTSLCLDEVVDDFKAGRLNPKKCDWETFNTVIDPLLFPLLGGPQGLDPQAAVDVFWGCIDTSASAASRCSMPLKGRPKGIGARWWGRYPVNLKALHREYHTLFNAHNQRPNAATKSAMRRANLRYKTAVARAKASEWKAFTASVESSPVPAKQLFAYLKARPRSDAIPIVPGVASPSSSPSGRLDEVAQHLSSTLFVPNAPSPQFAATDAAAEALLEDLQRDAGPAGADSFSSADYDVAISALRRKINTAPGPDALPACVFTRGSRRLKTVMLSLFNYCYRHGVMPRAFVEAKAFLLSKGKGGDELNLSNFRTIMITSVAARLLERLFLAKLESSIPVNLISKQQAAFRKGRSTYDRIALLLQRIGAALRRMRGGPEALGDWFYPVLFLDIKSAFDKVPHALLLLKLSRAGVPRQLLRCVLAYLSNRSFFLQMGDSKSSAHPIRAGVPQGGVLSPWLFLLFINDILLQLPASVLGIGYADDLAVLPDPRTPALAACEELRRACFVCTAWSLEWRLQFGLSKSNLVPFALPAAEWSNLQPVLPTILLSNQPLSWVTGYDYLGTTLEYHLDPGRQSYRVISKITKSIGAICRLIRKCGAPPLTIIRRLVLAVPYAQIAYTLPFYVPHVKACDKLHSLLVSPFRKYLHLPPTSFHLSILVDMGLLPILVLRRVLLASLLCRPAVLEAEGMCQLLLAFGARAPDEPRPFTDFTLLQLARQAALSFNVALPGQLAPVALRSILKVNAAASVTRSLLGHQWGRLFARDIHLPGPSALLPEFGLLDGRATAVLRGRLRLGYSGLLEAKANRHYKDPLGHRLRPECPFCPAHQVQSPTHVVFHCIKTAGLRYRHSALFAALQGNDIIPFLGRSRPDLRLQTAAFLADLQSIFDI